MTLRPTADPRQRNQAGPLRLAAPPAPTDRGRAQPVPAAPRRPSRAASLLAAAELDQRLATQLLRLPPNQRQVAIRRDPRFRRLTLAQLFALQAESALLRPAARPLVMAELAAVIAAELATDALACDAPEEKVAETAALAHWLLGKALLAERRWQLAEESFLSVFAFVADRGPCETQALAHAGLGQLHADLDQLDAAIPCFLSAARLFSRLAAAKPAAACLAELGLALHDTGDLPNAEHTLRRSLQLLGNPAFAPSLAARLHLALAEIAATLGRSKAASDHLERARRLHRLCSSMPEETERTWREARVAAAAGDSAEGDPLFDRARRTLLAKGSLVEAARCTLDQLLSRIDCGRHDSVSELTTALADAFHPADQAWADEFAHLARLAAMGASERYAVVLRLRLRLRQAPSMTNGRPPLLIPTRVLADRLLRCRGEHEDPIGAAVGL